MNPFLLALLGLLWISASVTAQTPPEVAMTKDRHEWLMNLRALPEKTAHLAATFQAGSAAVAPLHYFLFSPPTTAAATNHTFPLVVVLHHAGAERDLEKILTMNPESIGRWLEADTQRIHPAYVLAPWSGGHHWESGDWKTSTPLSEHPSANAEAVLLLIGDLCKRLPIDPRRIYLVGQSMGAFGVWDLAARRPDLFAAALPVCGGGDPAQAAAFRTLPLWTFHGASDEIIPVTRTREMAEAIRAAPAPGFRYTEYAAAGHDQCSELAFTERDLADWLFGNSRPNPSPKKP